MADAWLTKAFVPILRYPHVGCLLDWIVAGALDVKRWSARKVHTEVYVAEQRWWLVHQSAGSQRLGRGDP